MWTVGILGNAVGGDRGPSLSCRFLWFEVEGSGCSVLTDLKRPPDLSVETADTVDGSRISISSSASDRLVSTPPLMSFLGLVAVDRMRARISSCDMSVSAAIFKAANSLLSLLYSEAGITTDLFPKHIVLHIAFVDALTHCVSVIELWIPLTMWIPLCHFSVTNTMRGIVRLFKFVRLIHQQLALLINLQPFNPPVSFPGPGHKMAWGHTFPAPDRSQNWFGIRFWQNKLNFVWGIELWNFLPVL